MFWIEQSATQIMMESRGGRGERSTFDVWTWTWTVRSEDARSSSSEARQQKGTCDALLLSLRRAVLRI